METDACLTADQARGAGEPCKSACRGASHIIDDKRYEPAHADQFAHPHAGCDYTAIAVQHDYAARGCHLDNALKRLQVVLCHISVYNNKMFAVLESRGSDLGAISGNHSRRKPCLMKPRFALD